MKRWIMITILVVSVPALAAVNFTATDAGSGKLQIAYTSTDGDAPRGVALRISCSDGAMVDFAAPVVVDPAFNTFIDYAFSQGIAYTIGAGHPLANPTQAGALTGDASEFSISMGVLDQTGAQMPGPSSTNNLIIFQLKDVGCPTTITISGDTLRGPASGVVGSVLTSNLPISVQVNNMCGGCLKISAPFYNDWVSFGMPNCWCFARNCRGDADGLKQGSAILGYTYVFSNDLNILISGWNVKESPKGLGIMSIPNAVCADFARDRQGSAILGYARVFSNDLNILIANWNIKEPPTGPGVPDCMAINYNFFMNP